MARRVRTGGAAVAVVGPAGDVRTCANVARWCGALGRRTLTGLERPAPIARQDKGPLAVVVFQVKPFAAKATNRRRIDPAEALDAVVEVVFGGSGRNAVVAWAEEPALEAGWMHGVVSLPKAGWAHLFGLFAPFALPLSRMRPNTRERGVWRKKSLKIEKREIFFIFPLFSAVLSLELFARRGAQEARKRWPKAANRCATEGFLRAKGSRKMRREASWLKMFE
jgi:hypothetical protein